MNNIDVKFKRLHNNAVIPSYAHDTDAGMDLYAVSKFVDYDRFIITYGTGIAVEIPEGYVGLVFPKSSVYKVNNILTNCVGVIDSGYRGEIMAKFKATGPLSNTYEIGKAICQLIIIPYPKVNLIECKELSDSDRGTGGYGSTNR